MNHQHQHGPVNYNQAFAIGVSLNLIFVAAEAGFGLVFGSLSLVADAGHNLSDVLGLLLAWGALALSRLRPSAKRTYGFRRVTILAALSTSILLLIALGAVVWEALGRLIHPQPVDSLVMILVAAVGVGINWVTAMLFASGRKKDLNIRGAYLHMMADAGVSVGVVLAGAAIWLTGWFWVDPAITLVIVAIILFSTWDLLKESANLAVDAVPRNIRADNVREYLSTLPGVTKVHDLHIWGMSTTECAMTVHLVMPEVRDDDEFLRKVIGTLHDKFGIEHSTIQIERTDLGHGACDE